jgi:hypothetical protein
MSGRAMPVMELEPDGTLIVRHAYMPPRPLSGRCGHRPAQAGPQGRICDNHYF